jgi:small conductance mechanosensitive channel
MTAPTPSPIGQALSAGDRALAVDAAMIAKLTDVIGGFAVNILIAAMILAATLVVAKWAASGTRRALSRVKAFEHDPTVLSFVVQVVRVVVVLIGLIAVLQRLGVQTASIIAVLGAASLALGLALQGTLANVAAGMMLLILRPYRVGDLINVNGDIGKVTRLDLFTTQMIDANNVKIVVPNKSAFDDTILNLSGQHTRRMELKIGVDYRADLNQTKAVLVAAAEAQSRVLKEPAPWAGVTNLLDSSVEVTLQAWTNSSDYWQGKADVFQAAKEALDAAGINIPFPHQVAVPYEPDANLPAAAEGAGALSSMRGVAGDQTSDREQDEA